MSIRSRLQKLRRDFTASHAQLESASSDPFLRPLHLPMTVDEVALRVERWALSKRRWRIVSRNRTDTGAQLHLARRTRVMRFVDDIHVRLSAETSGTHLDAESQSRFGLGDLGQNPRNLRELVRGLSE